MIPDELEIRALPVGHLPLVRAVIDNLGLLDSLRVPDFSGAPDDIDVVMDGRGQLTSVTATYPSGVGTTQYAYDSNGRLTSITDPRSQVMSFTYDTLGRMVSYTDKLNKTKTWTFDEAGRELSMTNRNTETLTRTYDAAGRLATVTGPGIDRELRYDPLGRLVFAREGEHITETRYDEAGPTSVHVYSSNATLGHIDATWAVGHDAAGRLSTLVGPTVGGDDAMSATYDYDLRGRLKSVDEAALGTFSYGYDAMGRRNRLTRPNGTVTRVGYDAAGRATSTSTVDGVDALVHEILTTYDSRGLPETQTDQEGVHTYSHDQRARLVGVDHPDGAQFSDESYTYDAADRRTSSHNDPAGEVVYNDADQLVQDATYTYTYDNEGRRVTRTDRGSSVVTTYSYNGFDQMVSLQEGSTTWSFFHDAMNQRVLVKQDVSGLEQYGEAFVYDGNGTVRASYDTSGNRTAAYLTGFGFGEVLARVDGSGQAYALRDRLGTTVGWLDGAGAVASLTVRDAYGVRSAPAAVVPFGYTGHAEDPTGLVWGRARCYAPRTGGWTSEDPAFLESRTSYVGGSPIHAVDPTGSTAAVPYSGTAALSGGFLGCIAGAGAAAVVTLDVQQIQIGENVTESVVDGVLVRTRTPIMGHAYTVNTGAARAGCLAGAVFGALAGRGAVVVAQGGGTALTQGQAAFVGGARGFGVGVGAGGAVGAVSGAGTAWSRLFNLILVLAFPP